MNDLDLSCFAQASQSLQTVETHIERLVQEIEFLINKKKEVQNVKKYTAEIRQNISKIDSEIDSRSLSVNHCQIMLNLPPGSWVRNGTTKPGRVIELVIAGRVPEVHVQWHGASVSVPESPAKLTLVKPELVEYVWNGDRRPKLVRIIDGWECDEIEILDARLAEAIENKEDPDRRFKLAYCKKRIEVINQQDLVNLERAVRQGLQVFYRVGEALAEIRDRKLYKQHGFTDFRDYLREYWNMGKSKAYRLIDAGEVMKNITQEKSVPNWGQNLLTLESVPHGGQNDSVKSVPLGGQNLLPSSERITRELAKAPPEKQFEAWQKAVETAPDNNPTAAHTKAVVAALRFEKEASLGQLLSGKLPTQNVTVSKANAEILNCPDKLLIDDFKVGQLVKIESDRTDKRLVGYNLSVGVVTKVNPASVDIKIWGQEFNNVSPNDLAILDENNLPAICIAPSAEQFRNLISKFSCKEEIIQEALK